MRSLYNLINEFENVFFNTESTRGINVDVVEIENGYRVLAEIPGVKKEDINISFEKGDLLIEGNVKKEEAKYLLNERGNAKFKRVISFGDIKEDNITARYDNGILDITITLAKNVETKRIVNIE